ncbi:MAG: hypothetical protein JWO67_7302 [Streptosporangiaceae bacterium]|jgi:hypothetical protein|nr:hypothetical protein [Streptosporangiaceae bacterium]
MTIGLIVSVAVIAGWDALPVPDPSRHSQLLVLGAAVILGAAVAGIWRVAAVRREAAEPEDSREEART